jgi:hypothetical protein
MRLRGSIILIPSARLLKEVGILRGSIPILQGEAFRQIIYELKAEIYCRNASPPTDIFVK